MAILTFILTVYNKEGFLHRIFDSLLSQEEDDMIDYEVLVVNDGSSDGSAAIVEKYVQKDSRVRVLTQENQGLSMARNNGLDVAQGEYVWFVDADDIISPRSVKLIYDAMTSKPDVIPIYARTEGIDVVRNAISPDAITGKEVLLGRKWQHCGVFYVYKRSFLLDKGLRFLPGIYHEDSEFTPRMLYSANSVKVVPEVLYTVCRDPNSITQVPRAKRAFDYLTVSDNLSRFVVERGESKTAVGRVLDDTVALCINNAFYIIVQNKKEDQKRLELLFYDKRRTLLRSLSSSTHGKYRIEAILLTLVPKKCVSVYNMLKRI